MRFDIAIVGGGAAAVSCLDSLSRLLILNKKKASIVIFDKKNNMGKGEIYVQDYPWIIMNTPSQDLSATYGIPDDFIQWGLKKEYKLSHGKYVSREIFGNYLRHKFNTIIEGSKNQYTLNVIKSKVIDINKGADEFTVVTDDSNEYQSRFVILASRHNSYNDPYNLYSEKNYLLNPYPLMKKINSISNNKRILIIGSGLTGVDCAITLHKEKSPSQLVMASRMGYLPEVKGNKLFSCKPKFFLAENIIGDGGISLRKLLRYARKEFRINNIDWRYYLFKDDTVERRVEYFKEQVNKAKKNPTSFNIILGMIPELAKIWPLMKVESINIFIDKYYARVQQKHGAIPLINAEKILTLILNGNLHIKKGINFIKKIGNTFNVEFKDGSKHSFDYVVNATGQMRKIEDIEENKLYTNLLRKGMIEELCKGGIRATYPEANPLVKGHIASENLFLVGHNAEGTHIFTNNYQWIVEIGYIAAKKLINKL
ncbi:FAD/NAD(P)-binding protein [Providencia rettgeri]|nr:FAD/NAD(P)-binding protein [Providencia rettgeri]